jgi:hypothetical protein
VKKDDFIAEDSDAEQLLITKPLISYGADYTLDSITQYVGNGTIEIQPDFQRRHVWDIKRASKLIESFLLGYPVPNILLGRDQNEDIMEVIDGQQRVRAVSGFISGEFDDNTIFRLSGEIVPQFANKTFKDLDDTTQRRFKNAVLKTIVLVYEDADPNLKFSVFQRINTGSVVLTPQEIRNCIYIGKFNTLLHELNSSPAWRSFFSTNPDKRMRDEETILRFFAALYGRDKYSAPMTAFLNDFMAEHQHIGDEKAVAWKKAFFDALEIIRSNYSDGNPFTATDSQKQFNRAIFESVAVAIARLANEGKADFSDFGLKHAKLLRNLQFKDSVTTGTSAEKKYAARLDIAYKTLK